MVDWGGQSSKYADFGKIFLKSGSHSVVILHFWPFFGQKNKRSKYRFFLDIMGVYAWYEGQEGTISKFNRRKTAVVHN